METDTEPQKIYSSYTEAQKRATKKYRELNKEKVNAQRKKYYDERKANDPNFLLYKREKAKEYYNKNKVVKMDISDEEQDTEPKKTVIEEQVIEEPKTPKARKVKTVKKVELVIEEPKKENIKKEDLEEFKLDLESPVVFNEGTTTPKTDKKERKKRVKKSVEECFKEPEPKILDSS